MEEHFRGLAQYFGEKLQETCCLSAEYSKLCKMFWIYQNLATDYTGEKT